MAIQIVKKDDQNVVITGDDIIATCKINNCNFKLLNRDVKAEAILEVIAAVIEQFKLNTLLYGLKLELHLTRKMHQLVSTGTFFQKIRYIQLVGLRDEISRQEQFSEAVKFIKFNRKLQEIGIKNHFSAESKSKRIIAVHLQYVKYDKEISEGLHVMPHQHLGDNPVFVESETSLRLALQDCLPGATLVIDGHWQHENKCIHGVWDACTAEELAQKIAKIINTMPGKIAHVNLLGCESGVINTTLTGLVDKNSLFFKYDYKPDLANRFMGKQRNRAIYVNSEKGESVFNPDSLAFKLLSKLADKTIAVTATPKLLYPWPPENPEINIGSDTNNWEDPIQIWDASDSKDELCRKLSEVKSVTQINSSGINTHSKRPWMYRI